MNLALPYEVRKELAEMFVSPEEEEERTRMNMSSRNASAILNDPRVEPVEIPRIAPKFDEVTTNKVGIEAEVLETEVANEVEDYGGFDDNLKAQAKERDFDGIDEEKKNEIKDNWKNAQAANPEKMEQTAQHEKAVNKQLWHAIMSSVREDRFSALHTMVVELPKGKTGKM